MSVAARSVVAIQTRMRAPDVAPAIATEVALRRNERVGDKRLIEDTGDQVR